MPALSSGFSWPQSALARALALARPAAAVHVICCSEPSKEERWRRLQSGMSSRAVIPSPLSCAKQHAGQKQQKRRDATRPRPHIMWQYILEISLSVEYFGSTVGHSKRG